MDGAEKIGFTFVLGVVVVALAVILFSPPQSATIKACAEGCQLTGRRMDKMDNNGCFCADKAP